MLVTPDFAPGLKRLLQQATGIGQRRAQLADASLRSYVGKLERKLDALLRSRPAIGPVRGCTTRRLR